MAKNLDALILKAAAKALNKTAQAYERKTVQLISKPGAFSGFPGDIVDTGLLRASKDVRRDSEFAVTISYGGTAAPYALFVHEGYTLRDGSQQPGRPWLKQAQEELDIDAVFTEFFVEKLNDLG